MFLHENKKSQKIDYYIITIWILSFVTIEFLCLVIIWVFDFCKNLLFSNFFNFFSTFFSSHLIVWVNSKFQYFSCQNLSYWVLWKHIFIYIIIWVFSFVAIWVVQFGHNLSGFFLSKKVVLKMYFVTKLDLSEKVLSQFSLGR